MNKPKKMLGDWRDPQIQSLMRLIETQSKKSVALWCICYAQEQILPIYEKHCPGDNRPEKALLAARDWLDGKTRLPAVKKIILQECHAAAREATANPAAQAAARTCGQAAASIHVPSHALGLAFYGAAAIAYDRVGTGQKSTVYARIAAEEWQKMTAALQAVAVVDEPNPVKIKWHC